MIGVCIKYFHCNYGGMLQAYATTRALEERGLDYELIRYVKHDSLWKKMTYLPRLLNRVLLNDKYEALKKALGKKRHPEFAANDELRLKAFRSFADTHFTKLSREHVGYRDLTEGSKNYSAVITGSDQLWSPAGLPTNYYNLMFVQEGVRKISWASSFGVSQIPWYQKRRTANFLNRLDYISMRENRGSQIVEALTGRKVPTVLDPVFMFDAAGWARLVPERQEFSEPYIFAYFLGGNPDHRTAVAELARKTGLKVVTLRHLDQYVEADEQFGDYAPYDVSPERFLNLLRGAAYVCTDSFHGTCFSVIHHKRFMVFNRYAQGAKHSKNSRIDTLCQNLGITERRFTGENVLSIMHNVDYEEVDRKLEQLRQKAKSYLDQALEGVN